MATKYNEIRTEARKIMGRVGGKHPAWYHASQACSLQALSAKQEAAGLASQAAHTRLMAEEALAAATICAE